MKKKKILLISSVLLGVAFSADSQITVTYDNYSNYNNGIYQQLDTATTSLKTIVPGSAGTGVSYNFSALTSNVKSSSSFMASSAGLLGSKYSMTQVCMLQDTIYSYFDTSANKPATYLNLWGQSGDILSNHVNNAVVYTKPQTVITFPATYLTAFKDTATYDNKFNYGAYYEGYWVDSLRQKQRIITRSVIDGWGTVTTPDTAGLPCLRQNVLIHYTDSTWAKVKVGSNNYWLAISADTSFTQNYNYISTFGPIVNITNYNDSINRIYQIRWNTFPTLTIAAAGPTTFCSGGSVVLTAMGATSYTWSPSASLSASTGTTVTATPTATTTYTVIGTTAGMKTHSTTITVTVNTGTTPTLTVTHPGSDTICSGNSVSFTAATATSYAWTPATGLSATSGATVSANPTTTQTYTVIGSNGACTSAPQTVVVTVNPTPTVVISVTSGSTTLCSGSSVTLAASGATTYSWNTGATTTNLTVSPTATTTYTLTGTLGLCKAAPTQVVTVITTPTLATVTHIGTDSICSGSMDSVSFTAGGSASTYTWIPSTGLNTSTGTSVKAYPSASTTYTITGTTGSCMSATKTVIVTVNSTPTVTVGPVSPAICSGGTVTLTASAATGTTYSWNAGSSTGSSITVSPTATTTYSVTGTSTKGCISATATDMVSVVTTLTVTVTPSATAICPGGPVTLTAGGALTYTWAPATGLNATTGTSVKDTAKIPTATTYTVTGTSGTGCNNTGNVTVTVNAIPTLSVTCSNSNDSICSGSMATLTASGANTYTWSPTNYLNTGTGSSVEAFPPSTTTYTVIGTNTVTGCASAPTTQVLGVKAVTPPTLVITATPTVVCSGNSAILSITGATGYIWSPSATLNSSTGSSVTATPTATTSYTVTGSVGTCTGYESVIKLTVNPSPTVTITHTGSDTVLAVTDSVPLTAKGASTYKWKPATGLSCTTCANPKGVVGTYTVIGTSANGCTDSATVTIYLFTGMSQLASGNNIVVFPNPVSGNYLTINNNTSNKNLYTVIYDLTGREVMNTTISGQNNTFSVENLANGVYMLRIFNNTELVKSEKIVIIR